MSDIISIIVASRNDEDRSRLLAALSGQNDFLIASVEKDDAGTIIKSEKLKPDVLILDIQPPGMDGIELAPLVRRKSSSTAIILMCDRDENDYAAAALRSGVSGFLLKKADMDKLIPVIKIVNLGGCFISISIIDRVLESIKSIKHIPDQIIEMTKRWKKYDYFSFSAAERCIIAYIALGHSDKEIGNYLNYSEGSVKNIITSIKRRKNFKNRIHIAVFSLIYGLVNFAQKNTRHI